jgi:hypothetical protein
LKSEEEKQLQERIEKILTILNGEITIGLHMQFLIKNNHADLLILKQIKVNNKIKSFFYYYLSNRILYDNLYVIQRLLLLMVLCYRVQHVINFLGNLKIKKNLVFNLCI